MTWHEDANAHWDKIRERMRENPTIIKPQKLAHEVADELRAANAALKQMVSDKDGLLTALRAECDAAARDMRERCADVADEYYGKDCEEITARIRALPIAIIATEGKTSK